MALILSIGNSTVDCTAVSTTLEEVMKMLNGLMRALTMRSKKVGEDVAQQPAASSGNGQIAPSSALRQPIAVS